MTPEATPAHEVVPAQPPTTALANDWRKLLVPFTLAGAVESQALGHLGAFTLLFLQQLHATPA